MCNYKQSICQFDTSYLYLRMKFLETNWYALPRKRPSSPLLAFLHCIVVAMSWNFQARTPQSWCPVKTHWGLLITSSRLDHHSALKCRDGRNGTEPLGWAFLKGNRARVVQALMFQGLVRVCNTWIHCLGSRRIFKQWLSKTKTNKQTRKTRTSGAKRFCLLKFFMGWLN